MNNEAAVARLYRQRARELRTAAEALTDSRPRAVLLGFADDYDRLARQRVRSGKVKRDIGGATVEPPHSSVRQNRGI